MARIVRRAAPAWMATSAAMWAAAWIAIVSFALPTRAAAQDTPPSVPELLQNSKIEIEYIPPTKAYLQPVYERMRKRQFLEQLKQFLSPLQLPTTLKMTMLQCDETNSYYAYGGIGLRLCYEWPEWVARLAPAERSSEGFLREDVIVGGVLQVVFHELGHAVFDRLQIPVFGREEDAADQMAGFIMLQFGKEVARRTLTGTAYFWRSADSGTWSRTQYSDEHGTELQRYYNYLCIAYGGEPDTFKDLVDNGLLPKARAAGCATEYQQVRRAFIKTVLPHVDQKLMKIVQSKEWLRPEDGSRR